MKYKTLYFCTCLYCSIFIPFRTVLTIGVLLHLCLISLTILFIQLLVSIMIASLWRVYCHLVYIPQCRLWCPSDIWWFGFICGKCMVQYNQCQCLYIHVWEMKIFSFVCNIHVVYTCWSVCISIHVTQWELLF